MINHVAFVYKPKRKYRNKINFQTIFLQDPSIHFNIFQYIPRFFTIHTKSGSNNFNIELLRDTSLIISEFNEENPNFYEYHLNIYDDRNVLNKFAKMYEGKTVFFDEEDIPIAKQITKLLKITRCPNSILQKVRNVEFFDDDQIDLTAGIVMDKQSFNEFLQNESLRTFTIKTNKNKYKCNFFGVFSSKIIHEIITKDHSINEYVYDFDDEFDEFQSICDIFNFQKVDITANNMNSLKEIAEDLSIEIILNKIDKFIEKYEKISDKIDKQQGVIDSIDQLFNWLYHVKENGIISLKNLILDSIWSQTEENIQELAAFILQIINTNILLHEYLVDLLIELDKENNFCILIPFIIKKLMDSFGKSNLNCSFIYKLHRKGFISKKEIISQLINFFKNSTFVYYRRCFYHQYIPFTEANLSDSDGFSQFSPDFCFVFSWFLPEIIEINKFDERIFESSPKPFSLFIKSYYPNKIDEYKKMRDTGEPDDEIIKALRNDDVDILQAFISRNQDTNSKKIVAYNIFENFVPNGQTNFLNYSAAYGAIKCFKYLLLNHEQCDESTFGFAVFGGNVEIIKIVDQNSKNIENNNADNSFSDSEEEEDDEILDNISILNNIIPSITKHQNNLFDWIFEQKFLFKNISKKLLSKLAIDSVSNGNVHSFIEIIDKGFDFSSDELFQTVFKTACENGFYRLSEIIFQIFNNKNEVYYFDNIIASVSFGNLSIFKYYLKMKKSHRDLEKAFIYAVLKGHRNIIKYFFDNIIKEGFKIDDKCVFKSLNISVIEHSNDLFLFLIDQFKQTNLFFNVNNFSFIEILSSACTFGNFEIVKIITDSIIKDGSIFDYKECFTNNFIKAASSESIEICQYFLDKKVPLDFEILSLHAYEISSLNEKSFSLLIENCNTSERDQLFHYCFDPAIEKRNYNLVEYLLKEKVSNGDSLIKAVEKDDLKMVDLILKYKRNPSFINKTSKDGTALCIAVKHNKLEIVKTLLSIPGINPGLADHNNSTPLILSIQKIEIMNEILEFYGANILFQTEQIHLLFKTILHFLSTNLFNVLPTLYRILGIENIPLNEFIENENFLTFACKTNNVDILKMILNIEKVDVNISTPKDGDTPLLIAIKENNKEVAEILIDDARTDINARNYQNQTALMIAVSNQNEQIMNLLLNNEKFDPIESCLDDAFLNANSKIQMTILSSKSFDINHTLISKQYQKKCSFTTDQEKSYYSNDYDDSYYSDSDIKDDKEIKSPETVLQFAVRKNNSEIIDFIINHPSFDKEKSSLEKAIIIAISQNNIDIFKKLLAMSNLNFLSIAIQYGRIEIIKEILNNHIFNTKEKDLFDNFCRNLFSIEQNTFEIMKILYKYDNEHDKSINLNKLASFGETAFTSICFHSLKNNIFTNIDEIVTFLLENGADPNIPNKKGKYPLQHAIELNSIEFVLSLIKSNKIDFSKRMKEYKNKTFLHLAAESKNPLILREFLDRNVIDINSTDDLGETPLMYACRFNQKKNVELLFKRDDLDYLHCNSNGEDSLKIVQDPWSINTGIISNKDSYLQILKIQLKNKNGPPFDRDSDSAKNIFDSSSKDFIKNQKESDFKNLRFLREEEEYDDDTSNCFKPINKQTTNSENQISTNSKNNNDLVIENTSGNKQSSSRKSKSSTLDYSNRNANSKENLIHDYSSETIKNDLNDSNRSISNSNEIKSNSSSVKINKNLPPLQKKNKQNSNPNSPINNSNENSKIDGFKTSKDDKNKKMNFYFESLPPLSKSKEQHNAFNSSPILQKNKQDSNANQFSSPNTSDFDPKSENFLDVKENKKVQLPSTQTSAISARLIMNKVRFLQEMSEKGDADSLYSLGVCYALGNGVPTNKEKAFEYYLLAAEKGNKNAQYTAASCYSYGKGTEINKNKAFELYLKAAEQGFDKAQFAVGHFYEYGQGGVEKNHEKAVEWYKKAADQGHRASIKVLENR